MVALFRKLCYLTAAVLILTVVAAIVLIVNLNRPRFYERMVPLAVKVWQPGTEVKGVAVQTAKFVWPGRLELNGIEMAWRTGAVRHHAVLDRLEMTRLLEYIRSEKGLSGSLMLRSYKSDGVVCGNALVDFRIRRNGDNRIEANGILGELEADKYLWQGMHFDISGIPGVYEIKVREGRFYGGRFKADIHYEALGRRPFTGTVVFDNVPTSELSKAFKDIEQHIQGVISGDAYVVGDAHSLQNLEINLNAREKIFISSSLVGWLVEQSHLDNAVFRMIKQEIRSHPMMEFQVVDMAVKNEGQHYIQAKMTMQTNKHPFIINPVYEIRSDGDLATTISYLESQLRRGIWGRIYGKK